MGRDRHWGARLESGRLVKKLLIVTSAAVVRPEQARGSEGKKGKTKEEDCVKADVYPGSWRGKVKNIVHIVNMQSGFPKIHQAYACHLNIIIYSAYFQTKNSSNLGDKYYDHPCCKHRWLTGYRGKIGLFVVRQDGVISTHPSSHSSIHPSIEYLPNVNYVPGTIWSDWDI